MAFAAHAVEHHDLACIGFAQRFRRELGGGPKTENPIRIGSGLGLNPYIAIESG
jgi:hypothetical protein